MPDSPHRPLAPGDLVQLTDTKGRMHTITLEPGRQFHSHKGALDHDALLGGPEGVVVVSTGGMPYLALRPLLSDFVLSMPRGATVVYPKDAARIVGLADLAPGCAVLEAGAGSGALTCSLLRAIGPTGRLWSFERRPDFAAIAERNVTRWLGHRPAGWHLLVADLQDGVDPGAEPTAQPEPAAEPTAGSEPDTESPAGPEPASLDAAILDMLAPWECLDTVARLLRPGAVLVAYVATTTQLSRVAETLRADGRWTEPRAEETLVRTWHLEGLAVRPDHRMIGHTGFLLACRRLADGTVLPPRRSRPAPGAYGPDYTGPRPEAAPGG